MEKKRENRSYNSPGRYVLLFSMLIMTVLLSVITSLTARTRVYPSGKSVAKEVSSPKIYSIGNPVIDKMKTETPLASQGLTSVNGKSGVEIVLLTLPEVLTWGKVDYDVREQYFHGGGTNLCYCVRHLENICHNIGIPVRRTEVAGLKNLGNVILLVPDATQMLPETRAALDKWIAQKKRVIIFGEVPRNWSLQYKVCPVGIGDSPIKYNSIYFSKDHLSIPGSLYGRYTSYISNETEAFLTDSGTVKGWSAFICKEGTLLFCGWSPRLHTWEYMTEQNEYRFFARLLKEFNVDVNVPTISPERISNLKSLGVEDWGIWDVSSPDYGLAAHGFGYIMPYEYELELINQKFQENFLTEPQAQLMNVATDQRESELEKLIKQEHKSNMKVFPVIVPFPISACLYQTLLKRDGLQYRYTNGVLHPTNYWSPADTLLKRLAVESIKDYLSKHRVDGIFIDFARYLDRNFDYGPAMRMTFEKQIGKRLKNWPKDVIDNPELTRKFASCKRKVMTDFLGEFGLAAKQVQKDIVIEALFYWDFWPDKGGAYESIGQDPKALINMGAIDHACGMFYTSDDAQLEKLVDNAIKDVGIDAFSCILAPMSYFNEYKTTHQLIDQIKILKSKGVKHAQIFSHIPRHLIYNRFEDGDREGLLFDGVSLILISD